MLVTNSGRFCAQVKVARKAEQFDRVVVKIIASGHSDRLYGGGVSSLTVRFFAKVEVK